MFTDQERSIFSYHNGTAEVFGDPLALARKLTIALQGDIQNAVDAAYNSKTGDADGSMDRLLNAIRDVFALPALDPTTGKGVTDLMALAVYRRFAEFAAAKKI